MKGIHLTNVLRDEKRMTWTTFNGMKLNERPTLVDDFGGSCVTFNSSGNITAMDCNTAEKGLAQIVLCEEPSSILNLHDSDVSEPEKGLFKSHQDKILKFYMGNVISVTACLAYCSGAERVKTVMFDHQRCACLSGKSFGDF